MTTVTQKFVFHAAHTLSWHPGKCSRLHGHTYTFEVDVTAPLDANGVVIDFDHLINIVNATVIETLDHTLLNDVLPNPTAELIAAFIFVTIEKSGIPVEKVRLWETPDSSATVTRARSLSVY